MKPFGNNEDAKRELMAKLLNSDVDDDIYETLAA